MHKLVDVNMPIGCRDFPLSETLPVAQVFNPCEIALNGTRVSRRLTQLARVENSCYGRAETAVPNPCLAPGLVSQ